MPRLITATLAFVLAAAPLPSAAAPASQTGPFDAAKELYDVGRYLEAARFFEDLWREAGDQRALVNAGIAFDAAGVGHEPWALYYLQSYLSLASSIAPADRDDLARRIHAASQRTAPVELHLDPPPGDRTAPTRLEIRRGADLTLDPLILPWSPQGSPRLRLTPGPWSARLLGPDGLIATVAFNVDPLPADPSALAPLQVTFRQPAQLTQLTLSFAPERTLARGIHLHWIGGPTDPPPPLTIREPQRTWSLTPGAWQLQLRARGYQSHTAQIPLTGAPTHLHFTLQRDPQADARLALAVGAGAAGLVLLVTGLSLGLPARRDLREGLPILSGLEDPERPAAVNGLLRHSKRGALGFALASSGLGAGVVATTVALNARDRALWAEFGLGTLLTIAGLGTDATLYKRLSPSVNADQLRLRHNQRLAASSLIGVGVGMGSAALIALATRQILKQRARSRRGHQPTQNTHRTTRTAP